MKSTQLGVVIAQSSTTVGQNQKGKVRPVEYLSRKACIANAIRNILNYDGKLEIAINCPNVPLQVKFVKSYYDFIRGNVVMVLAVDGKPANVELLLNPADMLDAHLAGERTDVFYKGSVEPHNEGCSVSVRFLDEFPPLWQAVTLH